MNLLPLALVFASVATAQTMPAPVSTTLTANLPAVEVGIGPSWTRGGVSRYSADFTVALHIGQSNWFSYTTMQTPIMKHSTGPVATTIATGGAWIAAQSPSGAVSLVTIMQLGFTTVQATSTTAPTIVGSVGIAFRVAKNVWIMPYARAASVSAASATGGTAVFQPSMTVLFGFGGK